MKLKNKDGVNKMKYMLTLLILISLYACAPNITIIDKSGDLSKNYRIDMVTSDDDKLTASFVLLKQFKKGKYQIDNEYLDLFKEYKLTTANTSGLYMIISIYNPKMVKYDLIYTEFRNKDYIHCNQDIIYSGNEIYIERIIPLPTEALNYLTRLTLFKKGMMIINFGDFKYSII
jgi:hypothetical protein